MSEAVVNISNPHERAIRTHSLFSVAVGTGCMTGALGIYAFLCRKHWQLMRKEQEETGVERTRFTFPPPLSISYVIYRGLTQVNDLVPKQIEQQLTTAMVYLLTFANFYSDKYSMLLYQTKAVSQIIGTNDLVLAAIQVAIKLISIFFSLVLTITYPSEGKRTHSVPAQAFFSIATILRLIFLLSKNNNVSSFTLTRVVLSSLSLGLAVRSINIVTGNNRGDDNLVYENYEALLGFAEWVGVLLILWDRIDSVLKIRKDNDKWPMSDADMIKIREMLDAENVPGDVLRYWFTWSAEATEGATNGVVDKLRSIANDSDHPNQSEAIRLTDIVEKILRGVDPRDDDA